MKNPVRAPKGKRLPLSFLFALKGLAHTFRTQLNFRIHLLAVAIVTVCGLALHLPATEWAILALTSGAVLAAEAFNTAIEVLVDLVSPEYHKQAGIVKDVAAGAVLLAAIVAVIVGLLIFVPRLI